MADPMDIAVAVGSAVAGAAASWAATQGRIAQLETDRTADRMNAAAHLARTAATEASVIEQRERTAAISARVDRHETAIDRLREHLDGRLDELRDLVISRGTP